MADLAKLDAYLADHSYLGSLAGPTLADYLRCQEIKAVDPQQYPNLARWHGHVSELVRKYPKCDWRGEPIPQGTPPPALGDGVEAVAAQAPKAAPAKEPANKTEDADKKDSKGKGGKEKKGGDNEEAKAVTEPAAKEKGGKDKGGREKGSKEKKGGDKEEAKEAAPPTPEDLAKLRKDLLKKVIKEGGKRGVEIEGAADMGGLQFFCTAVDLPEGDLELLRESMNAMNAKSDPTEEERKGGSGHIGKMIFSAGTERLAIAAYVPEEKQSELSCEEWLQAVLALYGGEVVSSAKDVCIGFVKADADKGIFPLKIRETLIVEANNFLRKRKLFPEDDGNDDDDYVFGDDDFPS